MLLAISCTCSNEAAYLHGIIDNKKTTLYLHQLSLGEIQQSFLNISDSGLFIFRKYRFLMTGNELLKEFYNGDVATSKYILVYAIAKTDTLFFDFLFERYRDALMNPERHYLSIDDFDDFFESKKQVDLIVAKWGKFTLQCLTKGYRNILVDSGLGRRERKTIICERMMIHPAVEEHIELVGDKDYLKATLGGD